MEYLTEFMAQGFMVMLMISMPCVLTAAGIGLVVGILQAVTQVQEQTIAAAPKILCVFLVIIIFGMGFIRLLTNLFYDAKGLAFEVIPKSASYVLPADYYKYNKRSVFYEEMNEKELQNIPDVEEIMKNPGKVPYIDKNDKLKYNGADKSPIPRPNFVEKKKIYGH